MDAHSDVVGHRIKRLLQTPSKPAGVWVKEFGEAFWISLVAELDDGRLLLIGEFDCEEFAGPAESLIPVELVQQQYGVEDVEGQEIAGLTDSASEFAIALKNGLFLTCESGPGGNYPLIYSDAEIQQEVDWAATAPITKPAPAPITSRETWKRGRLDPFAVIVALAAAAGVFVSAMWAPDRPGLPTELVDGTMGLIGLAFFTVLAIPFVVAMPHLRVSFFLCHRSRVPSDTYAMPRWMVRFIIASLLGQAVGCFLVAIVVDHRLVSFAGMQAVVCGAFCASAWGRLKKHPRTEYPVNWRRWWPWR